MSQSQSPLTSPLSKARGLGSAKDGTHHWLMQRITAILMAPLMMWFVYSVLTVMVGASRSTAAEWFASPLNAIGLFALMMGMFYHSKLGLQVVIEDYVHCTAMKSVLLVGLFIASYLLMIISAIAIVKLHVMGI